MNTELREKERIAMERLKAFEAEDGYFLAYSGGKDSDCIKILAQLAGVKFETVHNLTTVDAPETVQYVRSQPDVRISRSYDRDGKPVTMWNLIVRKGTPPLRTSRYCCSELKEPGGTGKIVVTGVRWAESTRRKQSADVVKFIGKPKGTQKIAEELGADYRTTRQGGIVLNDDNDINRRMVEHCYRTRKTMVNPIVDWTDEDVWNFSITTAAKATRSMSAASSASAASAAPWQAGSCGWRSSGVIPATRKPTSTPLTKCSKREQPRESRPLRNGRTDRRFSTGG